MKKLWNTLTAIAVALFVGAAPAMASNGELTVRDNAKLFTSDGIKAARDAFAKGSYDSATNVLVVTLDGLPSKKKDEYAKLKTKGEQDRFMDDFVREEAKAEGAKGIFVLVATNPNKIRVIASEQMRANRAFGDAKCGRMQELLTTAFRESNTLKGDVQKQGHDVGLLKAIEYAGEQLKGTSAIEKTPQKTKATTTTSKGDQLVNAGSGSILGWVCLIGVVLLGAWLVIGLIRAFTGGGMGGGGFGGPGMGGGFGGGGGGFMSSLFGGMFGTMAGMWMYNNFFGGGMSNMQAGDYGGGGYGGEQGYGGNAVGDDANFDNGASGGAGGDWGDTGGGGGDYAGGDFGGGDFGGGGGGDFGGGGGDFGGGGDW